MKTRKNMSTDQQAAKGVLREDIVKIYGKEALDICMAENGSYEPISTATWFQKGGTDVEYDPRDKMCRISFKDTKEVCYMGHMNCDEVFDVSCPIATVRADGSFDVDGMYSEKAQIKIMKFAVDNNIPLFGWAYPGVYSNQMEMILNGLFLKKSGPYEPTNFEVYKLVNSKLLNDEIKFKHAMHALNNNVSIVDCLENAISYNNMNFECIAIASETGVNICPAIAKRISGEELKHLMELSNSNPEKAKKMIREIQR